MNDNWNSTDNIIPKDDQKVSYMFSDGKVQDGVYKNHLWWTSDEAMYLYFTPKFWKVRD